MEDQEFINQLAEKLSKLGTVRPLGFHYLHPYGTVPADSIICNGATYSRALYKDFFDYITTQGWVKTEAEWQEIAERDNGFCPFYSEGDGSTNFRTPKFAPYQQIAMEVAKATTYHQAGLPNSEGEFKLGSPAYYGDVYTSGMCTRSEEESVDQWGGLTNGSRRKGVTYKVSLNDGNPIYGRSDTVQPEVHEWVMCVVAYGIATNVGSGYILKKNHEPTIDELASQVRAERDRRIAETDYYMMPDYPSDPNNIEEMKAYRQALRDIPKQEGFPSKFTWPDVPKFLCEDNSDNLGLAKVGL